MQCTDPAPHEDTTEHLRREGGFSIIPIGTPILPLSMTLNYRVVSRNFLVVVEGHTNIFRPSQLLVCIASFTSHADFRKMKKAHFFEL